MLDKRLKFIYMHSMRWMKTLYEYIYTNGRAECDLHLIFLVCCCGRAHYTLGCATFLFALSDYFEIDTRGMSFCEPLSGA